MLSLHDDMNIGQRDEMTAVSTSDPLLHPLDSIRDLHRVYANAQDLETGYFCLSHSVDGG